jgi:uncharacterized protein YgiM (DUF1202 family)
MTDRCFKSMLLFIGLLTLTLCLLPMAGWAATLYAKQEKVKVTAKPSPTSTLIATLRLGEAVTVLAEKGRSVKVQTAQKKIGWVFKFRLASEKPSARGGSRLSGLTGRRTIAARESRAGGSIRGLKESTEEYAKRKQIKPEHQQAVDKMEQLVISSEELTQFKKEGQLGEFIGGMQ